jgi:AGCS family alanine or glycine:cation symporter
MEFHEEQHGVVRGGPMVYLKQIPGGAALAYGYAIFCLGLALITGNAMQCNSITIGMERLTGMHPYIIAFALFALLLFIMFGGAMRIIKFSEAIVPIKVGLFFITTIIVLLYNWAAIIPALKLILSYAFTSKAVAGGAVGFAVQQAMRYGVSRSLNATESGLGTAGILYGATRGQDPVSNSIMSMATSFISSHLVCFALMLVLIVTGVWDSGLVSTQLTMAAYESVFGTLGGVVVAFLSITFGLGVLVAYAYIGRECWLYLTGGRFSSAYTAIYCLMALFGSLSRVDLVWNATGIVNAGLVAINLYGLLYLLPKIRAGFKNWENAQASKKA